MGGGGARYGGYGWRSGGWPPPPTTHTPPTPPTLQTYPPIPIPPFTPEVKGGGATSCDTCFPRLLGGNVSAPGARRASFVTRALPVDCCR